ncbi:MAG: hypothetical protein K9I95_11315 [Flavobacteriaceae bacterium]|nr:hypothetical protein [Flavobacteriaceae bacterium]
MINAFQNQTIVFYAFDGDIIFYASKSFSKQVLKNKFEIVSTLDNYSINIALYNKIEEQANVLSPFQTVPKIQFNGELLEFDFSELSENESTVVFKGDLRVLCNNKQQTFLGSIKKINEVVYVKANLSLDISEFEFEKVLNCNHLFKSAKTICVEIMLQLKA